MYGRFSGRRRSREELWSIGPDLHNNLVVRVLWSDYIVVQKEKFIPHLYLAPPQGVTCRNFVKMFDADENRMIGLLYGEKNYDDMLRHFQLTSSYSAPPDPLAGFKGATSKGREGKGKRRGDLGAGGRPPNVFPRTVPGCAVCKR